MKRLGSVLVFKPGVTKPEALDGLQVLVGLGLIEKDEAEVVRRHLLN